MEILEFFKNLPSWTVIVIAILWAGDKYLLPRVLDHFKSKRESEKELEEKKLDNDGKKLKELEDENKLIKTRFQSQIEDLKSQIGVIHKKYRQRDKLLTTHLIQISVHSEMILTLFKDDLEDKPEGYKLAVENAMNVIKNFKKEIKIVNENEG